MEGNPANQVCVALVDHGQSPLLVAANIKELWDAAFRVQVGLGQSNQVRLFNGTGNAKFLSWVKARLSSVVVMSVPNQGTWTLAGCAPTHYKGPVLGKKSGAVAIEELVLSAEHIELVR
jgi:hypothetical protein